MLGLAPQHAPHTRPTACEKTSNTGYRKQANRHRLWIYSWVGQRCLAEPAQDVAEHNQIESLPLNCQSGSKSFMLFKLSKVSRTCTSRLATIRNPQRSSKKDQKGTSCLADIAQKCLVHHDATYAESISFSKHCGYIVAFGVAQTHGNKSNMLAAQRGTVQDAGARPTFT